MTKDKKKIKKVSAAIIRKDGLILICQRAKDDECPLLWEFPGGKQEKFETARECIIREISEELELDIEIIDVFDKSIYRFDDNEVYFTVFNASIISGDMRLIVHENAKWVTPDQLSGYEFMPPDVGFVNKLIKEEG